jgi:hypothetical protein
MSLIIRLKKGEALDPRRALAVKQHDGPAWIIGMAMLSAANAAILAQHEGDLHLPELCSLTDAAAQVLARHSGALHFDSLEQVSDDGLRALIPHPDLWIPEDINERISRLCRTEKELLGNLGNEEADSEEEDGYDDDEEDDSGDFSRSSDEWYDESNEDAYDEVGEGIDAEEDEACISASDGNDFARGSGGTTRQRTVMDDLLGPLGRLVGLEDIKRTIRSVVALARVAQQRRRATTWHSLALQEPERRLSPGLRPRSSATPACLARDIWWRLMAKGWWLSTLAKQAIEFVRSLSEVSAAFCLLTRRIRSCHGRAARVHLPPRRYLRLFRCLKPIEKTSS